MGVRWRTADGALTRLSVNEVSRRRLLELAMAAEVWECVAWLVPKKHHARLGIVVFEKLHRTRIIQSLFLLNDSNYKIMSPNGLCFCTLVFSRKFKLKNGL